MPMELNKGPALATPSNTVDRLASGERSAPPKGAAASEPPLRRTVAPHGVTGAEVKRLNGALHQMKRRVRIDGELWWLTTAKGSSRDSIAAIRKRVMRLQSDHGLWCYSLVVFETLPRLHAHIIFIGNREIAGALNRSDVCAGANVGPVMDVDGLSKNYLVKERAPQASFGRTDLGGRIRGSHKIEGGGDRVRLSRELERDAIDAGLIQDWQHTNAKRKHGRKDYRKRALTKRAPLLCGQILMFPEMKPVSRLRAFGGGLVPKAVAREIEHLRRRCGLTQLELAELIGRSQGQLANALRGHDPISARVVNRLRDVLLTAPDQHRAA
jgi:hypothetical protein